MTLHSKTNGQSKYGVLRLVAALYWRGKIESGDKSPHSKIAAMFLMISLLLPFVFYPVSAAEIEMNRRIAAGDERDLPPMTAMILSLDNFVVSLFSDDKGNATVKERVSDDKGRNATVKERASDDINEASSNAPTAAELVARVRSIKLNQSGEIVVQVGQKFSLSAMPLDVRGNAVHGLGVKWETSDEKIFSIVDNGEATAVKVGVATATARIGRVSTSVKVKVLESTANISSRINPRPMFQSGEPDFESRFEARNLVGNPTGAAEPSSPAPSAALPLRERIGSANFSFAIPLAGLSGRAMDVSIAAFYNSSLWTKTTNGGTLPDDSYTYNLDGNWASGFTLSYGRYETFTGGGTLTDPDGTRHRVAGGVTTDGTFIQVKSVTGGGGYDVIYTDGTKGRFTQIQSGTNRYYPTKFTDRNGNFIELVYVTGSNGKLSWIKDTMGRYIRFYYDNGGSGKLVAVTVPGFNGLVLPTSQYS